MAEDDKRDVTDEEIQQWKESGATKRSLGGQLYIQIQKKKHIYFQFRFSRNGKNEWHPIGKYPKISIANARKKADELAALLELSKQKDSADAFATKLTKPISRMRAGGEYSTANIDIENRDSYRHKAVNGEHIPGEKMTFRSMEDARAFFRDLSRAGIYRSPHVPEEYRCALGLLMMIPALPGDLLMVRWSDITEDEQGYAFITLKRGAKDSLETDNVVFVSSRAKDFIDRLNVLPDKGEFLFPELSKMTKPVRDKELSLAAYRHWNKYRIDINLFVSLFRTLAVEGSGFSQQFVDKMLEHDHGPDSFIINCSNVVQRNTLFEWWGYELSMPDYPELPLRTKFDYRTISNSAKDESNQNSKPSQVPLESGTENSNAKLTAPISMDFSQRYTVDDVCCWCVLGPEELLNAHEYLDRVEILDVQSNIVSGKFGKAGDQGIQVAIFFHTDFVFNRYISTTCSCCQPCCKHSALILIFYAINRDKINKEFEFPHAI